MILRSSRNGSELCRMSMITIFSYQSMKIPSCTFSTIRQGRQLSKSTLILMTNSRPQSFLCKRFSDKIKDSQGNYSIQLCLAKNSLSQDKKVCSLSLWTMITILIQYLSQSATKGFQSKKTTMAHSQFILALEKASKENQSQFKYLIEIVSLFTIFYILH